MAMQFLTTTACMRAVATAGIHEHGHRKRTTSNGSILFRQKYSFRIMPAVHASGSLREQIIACTSRTCRREPARRRHKPKPFHWQIASCSAHHGRRCPTAISTALQSTL